MHLSTLAHPPLWFWQTASYRDELIRGPPILFLGVLLAAFHYGCLRPQGLNYHISAWLLLFLGTCVGYTIAAWLIYNGEDCDLQACCFGVKPFGIPGWAALGMVITFGVLIILDLFAYWVGAEREVREMEVLEAGEAQRNYGTMLRLERARRLQRHHSAPGAIWGRRVV